ncbi:MAG: tetratricopeptide repeat protein [Acidiferrobacterales bacterium]
MEANSEADATEFLWVELNEAAVAQLNAGQSVVACEKWQEAFGIAQQFGGNDPRLASSLNNLAIVHRMRCNFVEAEENYQRAIVNWQAASAWVDQMHFTPRARSSLFHLRMEQKHKQEYRRIAIKKYQALLPAGRAATRNNLAELYHSTNRQDLAEPLYAQALQERSQAMGADEPTTAIIRENGEILGAQTANRSRKPPSHRSIMDPRTFSAQSTHNRWIIDEPAEFTDEGRLMAAILLTPALDHKHMSSVS